MAVMTFQPLGCITLVTGPEEFLADRVVSAARRIVRDHDAGAEVSDVFGANLDRGTIGELTATSLFTTTRMVVVRGCHEIAEECFGSICDYAADPDPDIAVLMVHPGGSLGTGLLNRLRKLSTVSEHKSEAVKGQGLVGFLTDEVRAAGGRIDREAAGYLVEAVGADLRGLASAAAQLSDDFGNRLLTTDLVSQYFSGRADVRGFEIADHALRGRTVNAMEELRWAMAIGVSGPAITGAFAATVRPLARLVGAPRGQRDNDLAAFVGVPPFRLRTLREQARGYDPTGLGKVISAVASADAEVKGAGAPPEWALERMVLQIVSARLG